MSEMYGINFGGGSSSPASGTISLSDFRNQVITFAEWLEQAKIQASDKEAGDLFGKSVAISGDGTTAIVGAWYEDTGGSQAGAAYIFTRSGTDWSEQAKILSSDTQAYGNFGRSVALSGDGNTAIVGSAVDLNTVGAAYIFTRSGTSWSEQAKIQASDKEAGDLFGYSVAISSDGTTAIVGAYYEDTGGSNAGAAYIFTRSGTSWSEQAKIQASDAGYGDEFGYSVSISGDGTTAIVGARLEDTGGDNAGAAYIFTRSGTSWSEQAKIQASDVEAGDQFGYSVSISGDGTTAIVGAHFEDTGGVNAGAAYIFTRSGTSWSEQAKILASDVEAIDLFGWSVAISGDGTTAIVGARAEDTGGAQAGATYIFTRSGTSWSEQAKIQASDVEAGDEFGYFVSISGDGTTAIVGAHYEDTGAGNAGAAYILAFT